MSFNQSFDSGLTGLPWKNTSTTTAPPHAIVAVFDHEHDDARRLVVLHGRRPTANDAADPTTYLVLNGPTQVDPDGTGTCYIASHHPAWAAIDPLGISPADIPDGSFAYEFGPEADKWTAKLGGSGYTYVAHRAEGSAFYGDRVLVSRNLEASPRRFIKITQSAAFLDAFLLQDRVSDFGGGNFYIEGKFVSGPYSEGLSISLVPGNGAGQEDGDPVKVLCGKSLRGILFKDVVCEVIPKKAKDVYSGASEKTVWIAVNGGVECFSGYVVANSAHPYYEVAFGSTDLSGSGVTCYSLYGDSFSVGQAVSVAWDHRILNTEGRSSTWLRITDWGCAS